MLFKSEAVPVQAEGFLQTTSFDIPLSEKAFKSLIDNIYSRKIEAPVRELSTNAFDAHIEAGLDEPFRMKLPTKFDPLFMVRDYGLGMTHDFIMGTGPHLGGGFKSLFQSTKDQDNKMVGMKGLGSKTPFAYTDAFILRIFSGETVRTYSTYLGTNGIPQLAFQGESPSDERRGTAVQFPVQTQHIDEFYNAAIRVLKGFPVLPEGLPKTVIEGLTGADSKPVEEGSFWKAYPQSWLGDGAFAKQGCVIYPIDADKIAKGGWLKELGLTMIIEFPIGTVQMVDSREFLSYDEGTIANINEAAERIRSDIDEKIEATFASAKSLWDIRHLFRSGLFGNLSPLARSSNRYAKVQELNEYMAKCLPKNAKKRRSEYHPFFSIIRLKDRCAAKVKIARHRNMDAYSSTTLDDPVFVYVGYSMKNRRNMNKRAALYLEQNPDVTGLVFLESLKLETYRLLGQPKIMRLTDLPELPKIVRPKVAYVRTTPERFHEFGSSRWSRYNVPGDKLGDMKSVYMFVNKNVPFIVEEDGSHRQVIKHHLFPIDQCLRSLFNTRIVFIKVGIREKLSRWPEAEYPRFREDILQGSAASMSRAKVEWLTHLSNYQRFIQTYYDRALDEIGKDVIRTQRRKKKDRYTNPLFELIRFEDHYNKLSRAQHRLIDQMPDYLIEEMVQRARDLGLEVLPEPVSRKGKVSSFPEPLLDGKWETFADCFGGYVRDPALFIEIVKEFGKSC